MNTPITDFVRKYAKKNAVRFHMPGHKGSGKLGVEKYDITEIDGADVLYHHSGIIDESQKNATYLYGSEKTIYSTEGSSLSIRAMVHLAKVYAKSMGSDTTILAGRNAHKTFVNATALSNVKVVWMQGENDDLMSCRLSAESIEKEIEKHNPTAVYITSPDYLGNISDISSISLVCKKHNVLLLVDNAHGSYLKFLPKSLHPLDLGADICCDSAHKTLPVLTGGAYLHIGKNAPDIVKQQAENAISLFASTSPSYLIMQSLDMANKEMCENIKLKINFLLPMVERLKSDLTNIGFELKGNEPFKITIATKSYGYYGFEIAEMLLEKNIVCEFYDRDFVVLMLSSQTDKKHLKKLKAVLSHIDKKEKITETPPKKPGAELVMNPMEAIISPFEETKAQDCEGKILARASVTCPPAVSIVTCGEKITKEHIECFKYYGMEKIYTVKM